MRRRLALVQGIVYVVTGAWPLLHLRSFEAVTGPKVDRWLVKAVAGMLVAVGVAEVAAARRDSVTSEVALVGAGVAATLGTVAGVFAARGRIRKVYFLDAAMEGGFLTAWLMAWRFDRDADGRVSVRGSLASSR